MTTPVTSTRPRAHALDTAMLRLLAPSALTIAMVAVLLLAGGHTESMESRSWVLAFLIGVPAGLWIGQRQEAALRGAPPVATAVAVAIGAALLAAALGVAHWSGAGVERAAALALIGAAGALLAPWWVARQTTSGRSLAPAIGAISQPAAWAIIFGSVAAVVLLMVPPAALTRGVLAATFLLTGLIALAVRRGPGERLSRRSRRLIDVLLALGVIGVVATLPDLRTFGYVAVHHHGFYLGPANEALHGRAMLDGTWSQYGVGMEWFLALIFAVTGKVGFGQLFLVTVALTVGQFLALLWTLRLAGLGALLAGFALATAILANVFINWYTYGALPSTTALRFGIPYIAVLLAVASARAGGSRWMEWAQVLLVGLAAIWSFEAWVYTAATFALVRLAAAVTLPHGGVRLVVRSGLQAFASTIACLAIFSLATWAFSGGLDWGPYIDYLRLYSAEGFSALPIVFFSQGPLMAALIFLSVPALLWVLRAHPTWLTPQTRAAIAGYSGFSVAAFTYYLGRSQNYNLLVLIVPVVAVGFLWLHALNTRFDLPWTRGLVVGLIFAAAWVSVASWPAVKPKWDDTLIAQAVPFADGEGFSDGLSVRTTFRNLYGNPQMDPRAQPAVDLLKAYMPGQEHSLVIIQPDLTTEVLMRAGRGNVLPLAHSQSDDLVADRHQESILEAVNAVPAGTRLLTSAPDPNLAGPIGSPTAFGTLQTLALERLRQRFAFKVLATNGNGVQVVELTARRKAPARPATKRRP